MFPFLSRVRFTHSLQLSVSFLIHPALLVKFFYLWSSCPPLWNLSESVNIWHPMSLSVSVFSPISLSLFLSAFAFLSPCLLCICLCLSFTYFLGLCTVPFFSLCLSLFLCVCVFPCLCPSVSPSVLSLQLSHLPRVCVSEY